MNTTAQLRGVRLSAQKGRLVADLIRGKPVDKALGILQFSPKKAATIIRKVLESAPQKRGRAEQSRLGRVPAEGPKSAGARRRSQPRRTQPARHHGRYAALADSQHTLSHAAHQPYTGGGF